MNWYKKQKLAMPMRTENDLPPGWSIKSHTFGQDYASFELSNGDMRSIDKELSGSISISPCPCPQKNIWYVDDVEADKGWGPLLYDTAMRWATKQGYTLTSMADCLLNVDDETHAEMFGGPRSQSPLATSDDANNIWDFYDTRSDVSSDEFGYKLI